MRGLSFQPSKAQQKPAKPGNSINTIRKLSLPALTLTFSRRKSPPGTLFQQAFQLFTRLISSSAFCLLLTPARRDFRILAHKLRPPSVSSRTFPEISTLWLRVSEPAVTVFVSANVMPVKFWGGGGGDFNLNTSDIKNVCTLKGEFAARKAHPVALGSLAW